MLEERRIDSGALGAPRTVWVLQGDPEAGVFVLLDGEFYVERMESHRDVLALRETEGITRGPVLFVSHVDAAARHRELTCSDAFARFVAEEILDWAGADPSARHLVGGLSLSGLQAAYTAFRYPDRFDRVVTQSASFWWERQRLRSEVEAGGPLDLRIWASCGLLETEEDVTHPPTPLHQEVSQIDAVRRMRVALAEQGATVLGGDFEGGHDTACWKPDLVEALRALHGSGA